MLCFYRTYTKMVNESFGDTKKLYQQLINNYITLPEKIENELQKETLGLLGVSTYQDFIKYVGMK